MFIQIESDFSFFVQSVIRHYPYWMLFAYGKGVLRIFCGCVALLALIIYVYKHTNKFRCDVCRFYLHSDQFFSLALFLILIDIVHSKHQLQIA